jgi:polyphenol oxidase
MRFINETSRRSFLRKAGVLGAGAGLTAPPWAAMASEPVNCTGPKPPAKAIEFTPDTKRSIVERPNAFSLSDKQKAGLVKAYTKLRELTTKSPNDPRGRLQQGDKHCWQCGGGTDGKMGEEIHGSWLFFPWHRGFLHFHERILGNLADDNDLRLPYWDWDNTSHHSVPPPYLDKTSSLFDPIRSAKAGDELPIKSIPGKSADLVGPDVIKKCLDSPDFATFGGDAKDGGNVEFGPHGAVHLWCGDTTFPYRGPNPPGTGAIDMGVLDTAAQDPVFFAHHSNIDRLWAVWNHSDPAKHTNPPDAGWKTHPFYFWDENSKWVQIVPSQMLDYENNLRYKYPLPLAKTRLWTNITTLAPVGNALKLPGAVVERSAVASHETMLRVDGVAPPADSQPGMFSVVDIQTGEELGLMFYLAHNSKDMHVHGSANLTFDISGKVKTLAKSANGIRLGLVRLGQSRAVANVAATPLSFKYVSILDR